MEPDADPPLKFPQDDKITNNYPPDICQDPDNHLETATSGDKFSRIREPVKNRKRGAPAIRDLQGRCPRTRGPTRKKTHHLYMSQNLRGRGARLTQLAAERVRVGPAENSSQPFLFRGMSSPSPPRPPNHSI